MKCIILVAGYATRLYPLTLNFPKALLSVGNKPIIGYIIDKLNKIKEIDEIFVITNERFFKDFVDWKKEISSSIPIEIVSDGTSTNEDRLGSIGDLDFLIKNKNIKEDVLLIAGDNLFSFDLGKFIKYADSKKPAASLILYDIKNLDDAKRYGVVKIDNLNKVVLFEEKPPQPKSTLIGTGIYYLPYSTIKRVPEYLEKCSNKKDAIGFYLKWLSENAEVYGLAFSGDWFDIGDIEVYKKVKEKYGKK